MKFRLFIPLGLLLSALIASASARAETNQIDPDSERIMESLLQDGSMLNPALVIYPMKNEWVLPLGQLAQDLGLAITLSPQLSAAQGFILAANREFRLDLAKCEVVYQGKAEKYDCAEALVQSDDIYVLSSLLERWFPIKIKVNSLRSQILIDPTEKLPEQLRREREQEAERTRGLQLDYDPGYPRVPIPYRSFEFPFIDQQVQYSYPIPYADRPRFNLTTQVGGELLGLEQYLLLQGSERSLDTWRFSLSRKSPSGELLGPLAVTQAQLFDVDLPLMPLIAPTRPGRGFLVSTFPLNTPLTFENTDFQGPLPQGWEVLLYRNEVLLERRVSDGTGRYFIKGVPLLYGRNVFRLSFFGPQGQRRDQYRTYNIDQTILQQGRRDFRVGFATLNDSGHQTLTAQYFQNVYKSLTATAGAFLDRDGTQNYALAGLTHINEYFLLSPKCAFANQGGAACETFYQMGIGDSQIGARYTHLFDFQSPLFPLLNANIFQKSQIEANVLHILTLNPPIVATMEAIRKNYVNGEDTTSLRQRFTSNIGVFMLQNELVYDPRNFEPFTGKWETSFLPFSTRVRAAFDYSPKEITAVEAEVQYVDVNKISLSAIANYSFLTKAPVVTLQASRLFDKAAIGFNVTASGQGNYSTGLIASFSLLRDPRDGGWHMVRLPEVQYGAVSALAFVDTNRNGVFDPGERRLPGITILANQRDEYVTDASGIALIPNLRPYWPADISVSIAALEDPFLRLGTKGFRVMPRPSKTAQLDVPLLILGQVDGYVTLRDGSKPKRGARIEMVDDTGKVIAKARSESDGFFSFEEVPAGKFRLRVAKEWLEVQRLTASPPMRAIDMPDTGAFLSDNSFLLDVAR